jgi:hypothetical protein
MTSSPANTHCDGRLTVNKDAASGESQGSFQVIAQRIRIMA